MTKEEAIQILDPNTTAGALAEIEGRQARLAAVNDACNIAVDAMANPVHFAGGCYCRECQRNLYGRCLQKNFKQVNPDGFCDEGRRREGD